MADPTFYVPRTPLGTFRAILDWLTSRASDWHRRGRDAITISIGPDAYVVLYFCASQALDAKANAQDDNAQIVEILVDGRGSGSSDISLIAECASWLGAVIFECQISELLTPAQWKTYTSAGKRQWGRSSK